MKNSYGLKQIGLFALKDVEGRDWPIRTILVKIGRLNKEWGHKMVFTHFGLFTKG
jgi:hypothetical protein